MKELLTEFIGGINKCEEFVPFGRDDLEDIISDLQEEYYRLNVGKDVVLKIKIADLIHRLCQLRKTMNE